MLSIPEPTCVHGSTPGTCPDHPLGCYGVGRLPWIGRRVAEVVL